MKTIYDNHFENTRFIATFNIAICGSYTLPLVEGNYFTGRGSGTKYFAGDQHLQRSNFIYMQPDNPNCFDEKKFNVTSILLII
jgi:hypothetical protein